MTDVGMALCIVNVLNNKHLISCRGGPLRLQIFARTSRCADSLCVREGIYNCPLRAQQKKRVSTLESHGRKEEKQRRYYTNQVRELFARGPQMR
jgi:hypothetical protein